MQQVRMDLLGAIKYRKRALRCLRPGDAIAVLDTHFGLSKKMHNEYYRRILDSRKTLSLVVWGVWSDNNHEFTEKDRHRTTRIAERVNTIAGEKCEYKGRVYFGPFLEHRKGSSYMEPFFQFLKEANPNLQFINSYIKGGSPVRTEGVLNEVHNTDYTSIPQGDYIWSGDGVDATSQNIKQAKQTHASAKQFGIWHHIMNLKESIDDKTPAKDRTHRPTLDQLREIRGLYYA